MAIQSIQKAIDILSLFSIEKPRWGITDIANILTLPVTTVSSIMATMKELGLLEQDPETRKYGLGSKLLATRVISTFSVGIATAPCPPSSSAIESRMPFSCTGG